MKVLDNLAEFDVRPVREEFKFGLLD